MIDDIIDDIIDDMIDDMMMCARYASLKESMDDTASYFGENMVAVRHHHTSVITALSQLCLYCFGWCVRFTHHMPRDYYYYYYKRCIIFSTGSFVRTSICSL